MLQRIAHIKNPLTVIALFSSVAEMSGAAALPWLDKEAQNTYIIFLMGFPCLLVMLFFCTLWINCKVLYAPSDYRKDKSFTDMFEPPTMEQIRAPEMDQPTYEEHQTPPLLHTKTGSTLNNLSDENLQLKDHNYLEEEVDNIDPSKAITPHHARGTLRIQALNRLGSEFGSNFMIDVAPSKYPKKTFDFVMESHSATCVGKVFYSLSKLDTFNEFHLRLAFQDTYLLWEELDPENRDKFVFAVIVISENLSQPTKARIKKNISAIAHKFPFQVIPKIWGPHDVSGHPLT